MTQVYIGVTDHLWERHCQKDFRNAQLEEYESWREMYLRMSKERERKLKQLTKSIVSAHSGKPKGNWICTVRCSFSLLLVSSLYMLWESFTQKLKVTENVLRFGGM